MPASALRLDVPVMLAAAVAVLPICFTGGRIVRWEGALLLVGFGIYLSILLLNAKQHPLVSPLAGVSLYVLLPAAALLLTLTTIRHARRTGSGDPA